MKTSFFNNILAFLLVVSSSFSIMSCSSEDGDDVGSPDKTIELLKSKKWYLYDEDIWTWGDDVSYDKTSIWLYFTSNNQGFCYTVFRSDDSALGYSKSENTERFTYTISGSTVHIKSSNGTMDLALSGSRLGEYKGLELTKEDLIFIANTMGEDSDYMKEYINGVKNNLVATFDEKEHIITIKSSLNSVFSGKRIKYLQEIECYGWKSSYPTYTDSRTFDYNGNMNDGEKFLCGSNCLSPDSRESLDSFIRSLEHICEKYENGENLDESEFYLYDDLLSELYSLYSRYSTIKIRFYVVIDDIKVCLMDFDDNIEGYEPKYHTSTCPLCDGTAKHTIITKGVAYESTCNLCKGAKHILEPYSGENNITTVNLPNLTFGKENGHDFADLGLSVKWATVNIGASTLPDCGNYYAWGELSTKTKYNWDNYRFGKENNLTKYGTIDNKTTLEPSDDVAHVDWGGSWRMPREEEWDELFKKCIWIWCMINGQKGYLVLADNYHYIFLPAAGWYGSSLYGSSGHYWASTLSYTENWGKVTLNTKKAICCTFSRSGLNIFNDDERCYGNSVRAVCP